MNRGERISIRTKSAIKKALLELIDEKNYPEITVHEITKRGNVGRSTLYRHYQSKADKRLLPSSYNPVCLDVFDLTLIFYH